MRVGGFIAEHLGGRSTRPRDLGKDLHEAPLPKWLAIINTVSGGPWMGESVAMQGRITVENSGEMRTALANALRTKPATVSVDLSGVSYMDTSGLATLVEAARIAREQGTRLILGGIHDQPRYFFEITHLDRLFDIAGQEAST
jgi:anti-sigma B factor antagonist